jgi:hypothetical protein
MVSVAVPVAKPPPQDIDLLRQALESLKQVEQSLALAGGSVLDMSGVIEALEEARARVLAAIDRLTDLRARRQARK